MALRSVRGVGGVRLLVAGFAVLAALVAHAGSPAVGEATRSDHGPEPADAGPNSNSTSTAVAAPTDTVLEQKIRQLIAPFRGDVGIYVRNLHTGLTVAINADTVFPTASMIKLPFLVVLHDRFAAGTLDPDTTLTYHDSLFYAGDSDIVNKMKPGEEVTLGKLAFFMISISDNTASLWIQGLLGGATVNAWLAEHGFEHTRVNSRVDGRHEDWQRYGWGQTMPREMAELLVMVRQGRAVSPEASEQMYRTLTDIYWDDEALSAIPPTIQVASKQGAVSASRSEVLLVNAPTGDYVLCIITTDQEDTSWDDDNEGFVLIRNVSRTVFDHFVPQRPTFP